MAQKVTYNELKSSILYNLRHVKRHTECIFSKMHEISELLEDGKIVKAYSEIRDLCDSTYELSKETGKTIERLEK